MNASDKTSAPDRGCVLSEVFCAHLERRNLQKIPSTIQSCGTDSMLSGLSFVHFLCIYSTVLTAKGSLRFDIDSHRLTSKRTSLIH